MICIRCRRESRGKRCLYCAPKETTAKPAPGKAKAPAAPTPGYFTPRNIIGLVVLCAALIVGGFIRFMRGSGTPDPVSAASRPSPSASPKPTAAVRPTPSPDDDRTAKQKRLAGLLREYMELQKSPNPTASMRSRMAGLEKECMKLAMEECGNDEKKAQAFVMESMARHEPALYDDMRRPALEALAASNLRMVYMSEIAFSRSPTGAQSGFWVADVSGLARIIPKGGASPMQAIDARIASADAKPLLAHGLRGPCKTGKGNSLEYAPGDPAAPLEGYLFQVVESYLDGEARTVPYDSGNGCNRERFAFCAFPAEYGKPCRKTMLMTETGAVLSKDTGGKPVPVVPRDPASDGWK